MIVPVINASPIGNTLHDAVECVGPGQGFQAWRDVDVGRENLVIFMTDDVGSEEGEQGDQQQHDAAGHRCIIAAEADNRELKQTAPFGLFGRDDCGGDTAQISHGEPSGQEGRREYRPED